MWWHWSWKGLVGLRERQRAKPGSIYPSLNIPSQSGIQTASFHMNVSFPSLQNIPCHSFLPRSCILIPLLDVTLSSWHSMNDLPRASVSVICGCPGSDANEAPLWRTDWRQCGVAWPQPNRGIDTAPAEINHFLAFLDLHNCTSHLLFLSQILPQHCVPGSTALPISASQTHPVSVYPFSEPSHSKLEEILTFHQCDSGISQVWHNPISPFIVFCSIYYLSPNCSQTSLPCAERPMTDHLLIPFLYSWKKSI